MSFRGIYLYLAVLLIALGGSLVLYVSAGSHSKPNVIVILLDTLRPDHVSYNGYERDTSPTLDAFVKESINFRNAVSTSNWTPPAIASLFTGVYPTVHAQMPLKQDGSHKQRMTRLDDRFQTLADLLKQNDYATAGVSANPLISERLGFGQGFDTYDVMERVRASKVNAKALPLLDTLKREGRPFFLYLHYLDPHDPYSPPKEFDLFDGPLRSRSYPEKQVNLMERYDGEIRYVDSKLGELFARLKELDLYDDAIIVILSDHGEQFKEHGRQGHVFKLHGEENRIVFLVKAPELQPAQVTIPVSLVDVLPTLMDLADLVPPPYIQGLSLVNNFNESSRVGVLAEIVRHFNHKALIRNDGMKYLAHYPLPDALARGKAFPVESEQIFNTVLDPDELNPLIDEGLATGLRSDYEQLYEQIARARSQFAPAGVEVDKKTLDDLKSLGYLK